MAEEVAFEAGRGGIDVVVVNPTTPVGEQDIKPTPTGRIVVDFLKKKFPAYVDTGLNLVDVTECARGHIAAMEKGRTGERYILGGENLTLKQILDNWRRLPDCRRLRLATLCGGIGGWRGGRSCHRAHSRARTPGYN